MRTVYKYQADWKNDRATLSLPRASSIVRVTGTPLYGLTLWADIDTEETRYESREFLIVGTGYELPDERQGDGQWFHEATVLEDFPYVWHIYGNWDY